MDAYALRRAKAILDLVGIQRFHELLGDLASPPGELGAKGS